MVFKFRSSGEALKDIAIEKVIFLGGNSRHVESVDRR
jgi:hypothetical protein